MIKSLDAEHMAILEYAAKNQNFMSFGGVCNNRCKFCSYNAERRNRGSDTASIDFQICRKTIPYQLTREDVLHTMEFLSDDPKRRIFLSGAFCDAEPYLNPCFFDMLDELESRFPHAEKMLYTSGKTITKETATRLSAYKNIHINASILTLDEKMRTFMTKNEPDEYHNLIEFLEICADQIDLPIFFWFDDFDVLESDIDRLYSLNHIYKSKVFYLRCFEYTKYHIDEQMNRFFDKCLLSWDDAIKFGLQTANFLSASVRYVPVNYQDPAYRHMFEPVIKRFNQLIDRAIQQVPHDSIFATSKSMYDYAKAYYPDLDWRLVSNNFYGGSTTVAELLTVSDVVESIGQINKKIVTPLILDGNGKDMSGKGFEDFGITDYLNIYEPYGESI